MARIKHDLKTTMDGIYLFTAQGWVSGSGGDMTGSIVKMADDVSYKSTDGTFTVLYGSGSLRDLANQPLPTGSMRVVLSNPAVQVMSWEVTTEASGIFANQAYDPQGGASTYRVAKYGHRAQVSGTTTFDWGFQRIVSGTNAQDKLQPAIPADIGRPTSPALTWTLTAWCRKTSRNT
jgi:hypothetical protein